jgi:hypothetical protein
MKSLCRVLGIVAINTAAATGAAGAGDIVGHQATASDLVPRASIETVHFTDPKQTQVRIVHGSDPIGGVRIRREVITFGGGTAQQVAVFRGIIEPGSTFDARSADRATTSQRNAAERIGPADPPRPGFAILRDGAALRVPWSADLFSPQLDERFGRIADAVHGIESRYGTDLHMWRLDDPAGPQGPMQVCTVACGKTAVIASGNPFRPSWMKRTQPLDQPNPGHDLFHSICSASFAASASFCATQVST